MSYRRLVPPIFALLFFATLLGWSLHEMLGGVR